jgi:hypothetical protein
MSAGEKVPVPISEVRAWATRHGIPVGVRGHVPEAVIRKFNERHHKKVAKTQNPWTGKRGGGDDRVA